LIGTIDLAAANLATIHAELASKVPADPVQWRPEHLEHLALAIGPIDLAQAIAQGVLLGGPKVELTGSASITATVKPADDRFLLAAEARGSIRDPLLTRLALTVNASAPKNALDQIDHRALDSAVLAIDPIEVATLARLAGVEPPEAGRLSVNARAAAGLDRISAVVNLDDVKLEQLDDPLFADLRVEAAVHRVNVQGLMRSAADPILVIEGTFGAGVGDILEGASITETAPIDATVRLLEFPLAALGDLVEREEAFAGTMAGTATVGGTITAPRARLLLSGKSPRIGAMDFDRFQIGATYQPERAEP
jgi:hypothetical protein